MLRSIREITGYAIKASDGDIGRCHDFLFDDHSWGIRYMVATTAKWLSRRKVIISLVFFEQPDWVEKRFPVSLTREQIENSPPLEEHAPVSRQYEIAYHEHYAVPFYWAGNELWGAYPDPAGVVHPLPEQTSPTARDINIDDGHLRSTNEFQNYRIMARDGNAGHIDDFLVDDITWALRYLVVDTRNWLPGRKVLISPEWVESVSWANEKVYVDLNSDMIKDSPEYDPNQPVNRQYEITLYDYYGRPHYWK